MRERVIRTRYRYLGRLLKLREARVRLADGYETTREIVEHPGAVAIMPVLDSGRIVMTRQYRIAARRNLIEIPAGTLEPGEKPVSCAKRELIEETGYTAGRMQELFSCYLAPGYSTEKIHLFLATGLMRTRAKPAEDERIAIRSMTLAQGLRAIDQGRIQDGKTICGLYHLFTHSIGRPRNKKRST